MRNALVVLTAVCIGGALVGCSKKTNSVSPVTKNGGAQTRVAPDQWTLKLQGNCPAEVDDSQCLGRFGFSINSAGAYVSGRNGESPKTGNISSAELDKLKSDLAASLSMQQISMTGHEDIEDDGTGTLISLAKGSSPEQPLVEQSGAELKFATNSAAEAKALLEDVKGLAGTYYLPNPCADGAAALKTLMASVQSCNTAADCAYFDSQLDMVPADAPDQWLPLDRCQVASPLSVGNVTQVNAKKDQLLNALTELAQTCGNGFFRNDCSPSGFKLNGKAAVCQDSVCRPDPSALGQ